MELPGVVGLDADAGVEAVVVAADDVVRVAIGELLAVCVVE